MTELEHELRNEIVRLKDEVHTLQAEVLELRHFIRSLQDLADASEGRLGGANSMELLEHILSSALSCIGAKDGSLLVLDEDTRELVFVLTQGDIPEEKLAGFRLPAGQGIAGWVVEHRTPTIVDEPQHDQRFFKGVDDSFHFTTTSLLAVPIIGGGRVLGVVEALNKLTGKSFTVDDLTLMSLLCRFAGELLYTLEQQAAKEEGGP